MDFFGFSFLLCGCPSAAYLRVCGVLSISSSSLAYINFCPFPLLFAPLPILHFTFPFDFNDPLTFFQSFAPSTLISPPLLLPFPLFIAPHTYPATAEAGAAPPTDLGPAERVAILPMRFGPIFVASKTQVPCRFPPIPVVYG